MSPQISLSGPDQPLKPNYCLLQHCTGWRHIYQGPLEPLILVLIFLLGFVSCYKDQASDHWNILSTLKRFPFIMRNFFINDAQLLATKRTSDIDQNKSAIEKCNVIISSCRLFSCKFSQNEPIWLGTIITSKLTFVSHWPCHFRWILPLARYYLSVSSF